MSLDKQRQFTTGDTVLSHGSTAEIAGSRLLLSTETADLTLSLLEAAALADFLRDQSTYPLVQDRLRRIQQYVRTGEITKLALYPVLVEILIPFLPIDLLQQVQDILGTIIQKGTELQA